MSDDEKVGGWRIFGRISAGISIVLSLISTAYFVWLGLEEQRLSAAGRLNEGDAEGCWIGLLVVGTLFVGPIVPAFCVVVGIIALATRSWKLGGAAVVAGLLSFLVYAWFFLRKLLLE